MKYILRIFEKVGGLAPNPTASRPLTLRSYDIFNDEQYTFWKKLFSFTLLALVLNACATAPYPYPNVSKGEYEGKYQVGEPYQVEKEWHYPHENLYYDQVGKASWYGPNFHGKLTANGEIFDEDALTAAHRTLPLPSLVRVTNIDNNRTVIVMVNDRGPFTKDRIIDVSKRVADVLGFRKQGTAMVRVQFLPGHTKRMLSQMGIGDQSMLMAKDYPPEPLYPGEGRNGAVITASAAPLTPANDQFAQAADNLSPASNNASYYPKETFLEGGKAESVSSRVSGRAVEHLSQNDTIFRPDGTLNKNDSEALAPQAALEPKPIPILPTAEEPTEQELQATIEKPIPPENPQGMQPFNGVMIQVGAFGVKENADRVAHKLLSFGETKIIPMSINGKTIYRVCVGTFKNRAEAKSAMGRLASAGYRDTMIVSK